MKLQNKDIDDNLIQVEGRSEKEQDGQTSKGKNLDFTVIPFQEWPDKNIILKSVSKGFLAISHVFCAHVDDGMWNLWQLEFFLYCFVFFCFRSFQAGSPRGKNWTGT